VLLGDSAMGTALQQAGLEARCGELWNIERGDVVSAIHRANADDGST
jgi:methionine synthase I (cobalamin-dependent)